MWALPKEQTHPMKTKTILAAVAALTTGIYTAPLRASDHADGPTVAGDQAADLADCYMFQDPIDPTQVVIINTVRGFIVPGEAGNFALFDSSIRYRFQIENTEDAKPDAFIDISFSEKVADKTLPDQVRAPGLQQTATVVFSGAAFVGLKGKYTALTTNPTLAAAPNAFVVSKLKDSKGVDSVVDFFGGETDDPFFFDIPAFSRFRTSVLAGATDITKFDRARDTFAGYNVMTMAFRLPISLLKNKSTKITNTTKFGINVLAQRKSEKSVKGKKVGSGAWATVDREGLPAVNALLIPLNLKNIYNGQTTLDDAKATAASKTAIVATLTALGTNASNIGVLAGLAVTRGDILRLDTAQPAAFPNGRTPADDVVDTYLTIITNGVVSLGDKVNANDVTFETTFPYLGKPHQPLDNGVLDDKTRN